MTIIKKSRIVKAIHGGIVTQNLTTITKKSWKQIQKQETLRLAKDAKKVLQEGTSENETG